MLKQQQDYMEASSLLQDLPIKVVTRQDAKGFCEATNRTLDTWVRSAQDFFQTRPNTSENLARGFTMLKGSESWQQRCAQVPWWKVIKYIHLSTNLRYFENEYFYLWCFECILIPIRLYLYLGTFRIRDFGERSISMLQRYWSVLLHSHSHVVMMKR